MVFSSVFPPHSCTYVFSHNLCFGIIRVLVKMWHKNPSGGAHTHTHISSQCRSFVRLCPRTRVSTTLTSDQGDVLHLDAVSLRSSPLSMLRRRQERAGHAGSRTHLLTDVRNKRAAMCSVSLRWNVTGPLLFVLFIFSYQWFQTTGTQFSPSQSPARPVPYGLLNKQDAGICFLFCKWRL